MLSNCWGCPQIVLTLHPYPRPAYTFGMHPEPENEKHEEDMYFHIEKCFQNKLTHLLYFLDEFLQTAPEAIYCSLTCGFTGTSSGNCQEMEICIVRACCTPRQPLQKLPSGHLRGRARPWSAEEMLDGQHQRLDIPAHAVTAHKGLLEKRLEEDLC